MALRRTLFAAAAAVLFASCAPAADAPTRTPGDDPAAGAVPDTKPKTAESTRTPKEGAATAGDKAVKDLAERFLEGYLKLEPNRATDAGDHRYDARWPDMSESGDEEFRRFIAVMRKDLDAIPEDGLSLQAKVDRALMKSKLEYWLFALDELRTTTWDPLAYTGTVGDGIDPLVSRDFAPIDERMQSLKGRLEGIPSLVATAKKRLKNPPEVHTQTAIQQNRGLIALVEKGLADSFAKVPAQKAGLEEAAKKAAAALSDFQTFLEKDLLPRSKGDFRLGRARFEKKLRFALDDEVDINAVRDGARALLAKTQEEMAATAKELWPSLMKGQSMPTAKTAAEKKALVKKVLDKLAEDRPDNKTIVKEAALLVEQASDFVKKNDLVRLPEERCEVIEMPEYRRGVAVAYCDASGPLEKNPQTFYAISPTPSDWTPKRAESFYREYNRSMLANLTVHEAMPGHFLQLMHNNRFPSVLRAVFASGPFVEGWAVYTEWVMAKYGFGGAKVRMMQQKMLLRLAANAILDHEVHAGTMDEKAALALMMDEAFQEEGEAVGKWRRAKLTSAQLTTYYYGFTEMMALRGKHEGKAGFSERAYHDKVLSFGSPSMRHLRAIMAAE
ncbi:MAG: DUF885 domain-containing protein [Polyangiaceae bacterium]|nr:DUF885 domain-containing protein [Polyangiaceae bacterium]